MEFIDQTGQPPSVEDINRAIVAVSSALVHDIVKLPPQLAVELPNTLRCLRELRDKRSKLEYILKTGPIDIREVQANTLRWAATQAAGALHEDAATVLKHLADRVEKGELKI